MNDLGKNQLNQDQLSLLNSKLNVKSTVTRSELKNERRK